MTQEKIADILSERRDPETSVLFREHLRTGDPHDRAWKIALEHELQGEDGRLAPDARELARKLLDPRAWAGSSYNRALQILMSSHKMDPSERGERLSIAAELFDGAFGNPGLAALRGDIVAYAAMDRNLSFKTIDSGGSIHPGDTVESYPARKILQAQLHSGAVACSGRERRACVTALEAFTKVKNPRFDEFATVRDFHKEAMGLAGKNKADLGIGRLQGWSSAARDSLCKVPAFALRGCPAQR